MDQQLDKQPSGDIRWMLSRGLLGAWNAARLKVPVLSGPAPEKPQAEQASAPAASLLADVSFGQMCKIGLAMTWPLILVLILGAIGVAVTIWMTTPVPMTVHH